MRVSAYQWNEKQRVWMRADPAADGRPRKAVLSADVAALNDPAPMDSRPDASPARRAKALDQAIEHATLAGSTIVQRSEWSAVLSKMRPIAHAVHLVACFLTAGLWILPYIYFLLSRRDERFRLEVDRWGHVWPSAPKRS